MRPLYLDAACFFQYPGWFGSGWKLLSQLAPQDRDFLLPGPSPGLQSCTKVELRYDMGFAIQGRLLAQLSDATQHHLIPHPAVHFWTPHSSRTFMPSATSALGFPKSDRDYLGGWAAENSDRYARVARLKIQTMQKAVVQSISNPSSKDPLGEAETLTHLEQHFSHSLQHVPEHVRSKCLISLGGSGTATEPQTRPAAQVVEVLFWLFLPARRHHRPACQPAQKWNRRPTDARRQTVLAHKLWGTTHVNVVKHFVRLVSQVTTSASPGSVLSELSTVWESVSWSPEWTINASHFRADLRQQLLTTTQSANSAPRAIPRRARILASPRPLLRRKRTEIGPEPRTL